MVTKHGFSRRLLSLALPLFPALLAFAQPALAKIELTRGDLADVAGIARRRVDVVLPDLADQQLVAKLKRLAAAGRTVRIVTSWREASLKNNACTTCTRLEAAGADLRYVENDILDSFVLADGPISRAASGDKTILGVKTGRTKSSTRLLRFEREGDYTLAYQHEFEGLWAKARDFGRKTRTIKRELSNAGGPFVLFSSANMSPIKMPNGQWLFVPTLETPALEADGLLGNYLTGAIDYAYDSIDLAVVGKLDRPQILKALHRALSRGVKVRVLLESPVSPALQALATRGATLVSLAGLAKSGATPRLPSNAVVIDRKTVLTGNFHWSKGAEMQAFASLLSLQGPVVTSYRTWMEYGFAKSATRMPHLQVAATAE